MTWPLLEELVRQGVESALEQDCPPGVAPADLLNATLYLTYRAWIVSPHRSEHRGATPVLVRERHDRLVRDAWAGHLAGLRGLPGPRGAALPKKAQLEDLRQRFGVALHGLRDGDQQILELVGLRRMSGEASAERVGLRTGAAVRVRYLRGCEALAQTLRG